MVMSMQLQLAVQPGRHSGESGVPRLAHPPFSYSLSFSLSLSFPSNLPPVSPLMLSRTSLRARAGAYVSLRFSASELYLGELWYYPTGWRTYERMDVQTDVRTDPSYQLEPEGFYYPVRYVWRSARHGSSRVQFDGSIYVDIRPLCRPDNSRVYFTVRPRRSPVKISWILERSVQKFAGCSSKK